MTKPVALLSDSEVDRIVKLSPDSRLFLAPYTVWLWALPLGLAAASVAASLAVHMYSRRPHYDLPTGWAVVSCVAALAVAGCIALAVFIRRDEASSVLLALHALSGVWIAPLFLGIVVYRYPPAWVASLLGGAAGHAIGWALLSFGRRRRGLDRTHRLLRGVSRFNRLASTALVRDELALASGHEVATKEHVAVHRALRVARERMCRALDVDRILRANRDLIQTQAPSALRGGAAEPSDLVGLSESQGQVDSLVRETTAFAEAIDETLAELDGYRR